MWPVTADHSATINAAVLTASAAVSVGGVAVGASIGASVARNFIGYDLWGSQDAAEVQAYVTDSTVKALGRHRSGGHIRGDGQRRRVRRAR